MAKTEESIHQLEKKLESNFDLKNLEKPTSFLGIHFTWSYKSVCLNEERTVAKLFTDTEMLESKAVQAQMAVSAEGFNEEDEIVTEIFSFMKTVCSKTDPRISNFRTTRTS